MCDDPLRVGGLSTEAKVEAIALYRHLYGHCDVPFDFVVPVRTSWPKHLHGVRLGRAVQALQMTKSALPEAVEATLDALGFAWTLSPSIVRLVEPKTRAIRRVAWQALVDAFVCYKDKFGDVKVPLNFIVPRHTPWPAPLAGLLLHDLLRRLETQIYCFSDGYLDKMHALGLLTHFPRWHDAVAQLAVYKRLHGRADVPLDYVVPSAPDGPWAQAWAGTRLGEVAWQLGLFRRQLASGYQRQLDDVGLTFNTPETWAHIMAGLDVYVKVHGVLDVPKGFVVPSEASNWPEHLWGLRLGDYRVRLSHAMRLRLVPRATRDAYKALKARQPSEAEIVETMTPQLASPLLSKASTVATRSQPPAPITVSMKTSSSVPASLSSLDAISSITMEPSVVTEELLSKYKTLHGHCDVPLDFIVPSGSSKWGSMHTGVALGAMVAGLRQRQTSLLTAERESIHALGFVWDDKTDELWRDLVQVLRLWRTEYPSMVVDETTVLSQRGLWPSSVAAHPWGYYATLLEVHSGMATSDHREALDALRFDYRGRWFTKLQALLTYKKLHGTMQVPASFMVPQSHPFEMEACRPWPSSAWGQPLGAMVTWLRQLREIMCPKKRRQLETLGFEWTDNTAPPSVSIVASTTAVKKRKGINPPVVVAKKRAVAVIDLTDDLDDVDCNNNAANPFLMASGAGKLQKQLSSTSSPTEVKMLGMQRDAKAAPLVGAWTATAPPVKSDTKRTQLQTPPIAPARCDASRVKSELATSRHTAKAPSWDESVLALMMFKALHGHCNVPPEYHVPPQSADWPEVLWSHPLGPRVAQLRRDRSRLPPAVQSQLTALNLLW
ncbi:hypothetical protein ACHHYP_14959 [Achlya hypogyna]|uniref:Helicase-associated domain-containing protein n=1 Tax=Achlya hypogyna TaxID=1202772 RepID=A0A1V9YBX9_ACHHY|nr:hypothetical protein ACHHYP_14959 [Achlya hypogyna]